MKKLLISMLVSLLFATSIFSNIVDPTIITKKGINYLEVSIDCNAVIDECTTTFASVDLTKIKAISRLKSFKSWNRLMLAGKLELINIEYRDNKQILTFIICHSRNRKLRSNNFGSEILRTGKE